MSTKSIKEQVDELVSEGSKVGEQIKHFSDFARMVLEDTGEFTPMIHGFTEDNKIIIIACPWGGPKEKEVFFNKTGPMVLAANGIKSFIFGSEVHMKRVNNLDEYKGSLEGDPEADDGLMCLYVSDEEVMHNIMPVTIIRDNSGKVVKATVGKGNWSQGDGFSGRLVEMLEKSKQIPQIMAKVMFKLASKKGDEEVLTKEERDEVTSFIMEEAKKGKLPMDMAQALSFVNEKVNNENSH
jgi:hypothetical protein